MRTWLQSLTITSRRINGNSPNHSTANKTRAKTSAFEAKREARTTEAEMAALMDKADGKLGTAE